MDTALHNFGALWLENAEAHDCGSCISYCRCALLNCWRARENALLDSRHYRDLCSMYKVCKNVEKWGCCSIGIPSFTGIGSLPQTYPDLQKQLAQPHGRRAVVFTILLRGWDSHDLCRVPLLRRRVDRGKV